MEPRLLVFIDNEQLSQMFICAENQELFEVPGERLVEGLLHLMASYYVFGVEYPKVCRALLYFFQDIIMERPDTHGQQRTDQHSIKLLLVGFNYADQHAIKLLLVGFNYADQHATNLLLLGFM